MDFHTPTVTIDGRAVLGLVRKPTVGKCSARSAMLTRPKSLLSSQTQTMETATMDVTTGTKTAVRTKRIPRNFWFMARARTNDAARAAGTYMITEGRVTFIETQNRRSCVNKRM